MYDIEWDTGTEADETCLLIDGRYRAGTVLRSSTADSLFANNEGNTISNFPSSASIIGTKYLLLVYFFFVDKYNCSVINDLIFL